MIMESIAIRSDVRHICDCGSKRQGLFSLSLLASKLCIIHYLLATPEMLQKEFVIILECFNIVIGDWGCRLGGPGNSGTLDGRHDGVALI
jgi:hypothetical protein